jgi:hypothetical protein
LTVIDKGVVKAVPAVAVSPAPVGEERLIPVEAIHVMPEAIPEVDDKESPSVVLLTVKVVVPITLEVILKTATPEAFVTAGEVVIVSPV